MPPRGFDRSRPPWRDDPLIRALTDEQLDALAAVLIRLARASAERRAVSNHHEVDERHSPLKRAAP